MADSVVRRINSKTTSENDSPSTTTAGGDEQYFQGDHYGSTGTDLALKSIVPIRHHINGYILATCCHGVCSWDLYVGRDFLEISWAQLLKMGNHLEKKPN